MTADEAGFSAWNACSAVAERLVAAADALPGHALKRHGRFQTWEIDAHAGDALMRTLINLALFAAVRDESVHHPRPATDIIGTLQISTLEEALYSRPRHEFFASLPITALDQQDKQRIQALRLLTYHTGAALPLERLAQEARTTCQKAAASISSSEPTCGDLGNRAPYG